jgi:hypothetical protein
MRAHEREHKEDQSWVSTFRQLSQSQEGSNTDWQHQTVVVHHNAISRPAIT